MSTKLFNRNVTERHTEGSSGSGWISTHSGVPTPGHPPSVVLLLFIGQTGSKP